MPTLSTIDAALIASAASSDMPSIVPALENNISLKQIDDEGHLLGTAYKPNDSALLDLSTERLEVQDNLQWGGRLVGELSDTELAAALQGVCTSPPPEQPSIRNQTNWLKLRVQWPQPRLHVHLRIDEIVLEWFRKDGPGFQGRMNAVLRAYVDAQMEAARRGR